jgi:hypothetical protein
MFFQRGGSSTVLERDTLRLHSFKGSIFVLVLKFDFTACRNTNIYALTVNAASI